MEFKHYVGVDISKESLDFALCYQGKIILIAQSENNKRGISQLVKKLRKVDGFAMTTSLFCMEHTGVYNYHLQEYLHASKSKVWLESALRIKQSQGMTRGKSDQIDAERIAQYAYTFREKAKLWKPQDEMIKKVKTLITMRDRLQSSIKQLTVPLEENSAFMDKELARMEKRGFRNTLQALKKDMALVEKMLKQTMDGDAQLKELFQLVTSVDGVGPIVAVNVIAVTNRFQNFDDPKKFACYCGVVPFQHQSGSSIRGRTKISHLANKKLKTLLHLAAMAAINMKGELQAYYRRKVAEGKNKMSVINAVRNKILLRIFAVVKRQSPYLKKYDLCLA